MRQQTYSNHIVKLLDSIVIEILEIFSEDYQHLMKAIVSENNMFGPMELITVDPIACPTIVVRVGDMIAEVLPCLKLLL
jgi:hypothetical protein